MRQGGGRFTVWVLSLLLLMMGVASAADDAGLAQRRARHLRRGINAAIWFAQHPSDYSVERLRSFMTVDDAELIRRLGFDHVRLSVDAEPLEAGFRAPEWTSPFLKELDAAVKMFTDRGLAVIVDIHPESRYKATLTQGTQGVERFGLMWERLAKHYSGTDPELVYFEVMNEPEEEDAFRWQGIESAVAMRIRAAAPRHTIIATAARWDGLDDLLKMQPLPLANVIYTFHDYDPFPFTHQGATWTDGFVEPLRGVPYPSSPEAVQGEMAQEPTLAGKYFVEQYGLARWDARRMEETVKFAQMWAQQYGAPVYCGEFGVHRPYAPAAMRAAWTRDMRTALESHGIGWAMWDYQTNFGLVTKRDGKAVADPAMVEALGLKGAP